MRSGIRASIRAGLSATLVTVTVLAAQASSGGVPPAPGSVFDDFEDNDTSDWTFFLGNNAGGAGGPAGDRPKQGSVYFSTGWGGNGTASGFYGGAFKNLPNASQLVLPVDPWFNVWVFNQADTTVDQYTLELTIREDTNGDGWTDGLEDSIGLETTFTSFDDDWMLVSAPLSAFFDRGTGGNGVFDGDVDQIVIAFGGVQGGAGTTIEVDFDQLTFTSGGPAALDEALFDDMEHGDPYNNGWFAFNGSVGGGAIASNDTDLPPANGGAFSLETDWASGGTPGFYGGFGRTSPTDASGTDAFSFWINPDAGQDYTLEINLQEDDNSDGAANASDDDEFQYNCDISATGPCAVSGGGWQLVSIPLDDFFDDNSFFTGGNGVLDPTPAARGGNGELINVVFAVIGNSGSDVDFRTDYWAFTRGPLAQNRRIIDDFELGGTLPNGTDSNGTAIGFFTLQGAGSTVAISNPGTPPAPLLPGVGMPNRVMQLDLDVNSFAGFIHAFENPAVDTWVPQDWSTSEGFSLWFHGTGAGTTVFIDILDNRDPGSTTDDAERWTVSFTDDFAGWQQLEFPFSSFARKEIGNGAPNDGLGLLEMWGWALGTLSTNGGPQTYYIDEVALFGIVEPGASCTVELDKQIDCGGGFIDIGDVDESCVGWSATESSDAEIVKVRYRIENTGDVPLTNCQIDESNKGIADLIGVGSLDVGQRKTRRQFDQTCSDDLAADEPDTATVTCWCAPDGTDTFPPEPVTDSDTANFECQTPELNITKSCVSTGGTSFDFEIEVSNPGVTTNPATLDNCVVEDGLVFGKCIGVDPASYPFSQNVGTLAPGDLQAVSFPGNDVFPASCNVARVTCDVRDSAGPKQFTARANDECRVCSATIDKQIEPGEVGNGFVDVTGDDDPDGTQAETAVGQDREPVEKKFIVNNTGNVAIRCSVTDSISGDVLTDVEIAPGGMEMASVTGPCGEGATAEGTDTATLACECLDDEGFPWGETVNATDTAELQCEDACFFATPTRGCRVNGVIGTCRGTPGTDVMLGTPGKDVMFGRGGDDYMVGYQKADLLCGGPGDDVLIGNGGRDTLIGQGGDDILEALGGRDTLDGGPGNDKLDGGAGVDACFDVNDGSQTFPFESCEN